MPLSESTEHSNADTENRESKSMQPDWMQRWNHLKWKYLVYASEDIVVFIDDEIDVDWETGQGYADLAPEQNELLNDAATVETVPCDHLDADVKLKFKRLIGESIARCLSHDHRNARRMLDVALSYVNARNREKARYWYLKASSMAAAFSILIGLLVWFYRDGVILTWGESAFLVFLATSSGASGAFLSIATRLGSTILDSTAGKTLHYMEAVSRVAVGALSGVLVMLAVNSGLFLPPVLKASRPIWGLLLVSMAAGASERLAPSLIEKINAWQTTKGHDHNSQSYTSTGNTNDETSTHNP